MCLQSDLDHAFLLWCLRLLHVYVCVTVCNMHMRMYICVRLHICMSVCDCLCEGRVQRDCEDEKEGGYGEKVG